VDVAVEVVEVLANYRPDMAERITRDDVATNLARALGRRAGRRPVWDAFVLWLRGHQARRPVS